MKRFLLLSALSAAAVAPTAFSQGIVNTSTRGMAGGGASALITGFVVDAPPDELRWYVVRVAGPTLASFGVEGALADPSFRLYDVRGTVVAANNDRGTVPNAALLDTVSAAVGTVPLSDPKESAVLVGLPGGAYTGVVSTPAGGAGVVLIETFEYEPVAPGTPSQTLSGIAASNPSFSTLATALRLTGLDAVLAEGGPFTVFAPTDEAFAKLPAGTLEALVANPAQLADILRYHVVSGAVKSTDLTNNQQVPTLLTGAAPLTVTLDGGVRVKTSTVVAADVMAINGVIHVIDTVLVP
jgi:uncharacterized surface protein with fasciclin (FAS1) repeats